MPTSPQKPRLVILDSHGILFRAFFAFANSDKPLMTSKGELTFATHGYAETLIRVLDLLKPTHICAAWDAGGPTFRHVASDAYKATRRPTPSELLVQMKRVRQMLEAFNIPIDELRGVSDHWLKDKAGAEKGFSLGFFDAAYVSRFPVAVIERQGRILAFGSLWPGPNTVELSVDLMRYHRDAPKGVMEMLFVHLIKWGQDQGYRRFALGMAPLSGVEASPVAPLWNRIGAFLFEHGEGIYRFQGLRAYKDKFDPVWEPHYLAYVGGMRLPRILADVSALIAGGYRRIFLK